MFLHAFEKLVLEKHTTHSNIQLTGCAELNNCSIIRKMQEETYKGRQVFLHSSIT